MAKLEMIQLFYPDHIEKLKVDLDKDGKRPLNIEHYHLLKKEAIKNYNYKKPKYIDGDIVEFYYLIDFFREMGVPLLLEVNTETPKTHILYITEDISSLENTQIELLLSKKNSWKRFQQSYNHFHVVAFNSYEEIRDSQYKIYTADNLVNSLYKEKYASVFNMNSLEKNSVTR